MFYIVIPSSSQRLGIFLQCHIYLEGSAFLNWVDSKVILCKYASKPCLLDVDGGSEPAGHLCALS